MACRVDELRNVGDTWVYEVASLSFVIVRSDPQTIKAFYNSCLHRGRPLRDCPGQVSHLKRSEEHTSELQSLMRISYAVFCLKKKKQTNKNQHNSTISAHTR